MNHEQALEAAARELADILLDAGVFLEPGTHKTAVSRCISAYLAVHNAVAMDWQPIETAPKGEKKSYGYGPRILGVIVGTYGIHHSIVHWEYHKNPERGAWKGPHGCWEPTHWMPLPAPSAPVAECERRGGQTPNQPEHSDRMLENQLQKVNEAFRKATEQL